MFIKKQERIIEEERKMGVRRKGILWRVEMKIERKEVEVGVRIEIMEKMKDVGEDEFMGVRKIKV